ncbi:MAG: DNA cytosine methyltransferase [Planctomycetota bacterium]
MELVLSLFPGIDVLGRGFEELGFSVVRGPDTLWDQRIEDFHTIPNRFDGIIGGPPCQNYSDANRCRKRMQRRREGQVRTVTLSAQSLASKCV